MGVFGCVGGEDETIRFIIFCPAYANPQADQYLEQVCLNKWSEEPERSSNGEHLCGSDWGKHM